MPAEEHYGVGRYTGYFKAENKVVLRVPSLPSSLLLFGQGQVDHGTDLGTDVQAGLAAATNQFDGRFWKLITLEFPEGHHLHSSVVGAGGELGTDDESTMQAKMVKLRNDYFALFKVARMDAPVTHFVAASR